MQLTDWQDDAACADADPAIFFPSSETRGRKVAATFCYGCPVIQQCLTLAMTNNYPYGVWGGTTERDRRRLKRVFRNTRATGTVSVESATLEDSR
jgi:WhiB family redox-sensing transcriptional regulator